MGEREVGTNLSGRGGVLDTEGLAGSWVLGFDRVALWLWWYLVGSFDRVQRATQHKSSRTVKVRAGVNVTGW